MKKTFKTKFFLNVLQYTLLSGLLFGSIGYLLSVDSHKINRTNKSIEYTNVPYGQKEHLDFLILDPNKNGGRRFLKDLPEPRHKPMAIDALYTSVNLQLLKDVFNEYNNVAWDDKFASNKSYNLSPWSSQLAKEYYAKDDYLYKGPNYINQNQTGIKLNRDGTIMPHFINGSIDDYGAFANLNKNGVNFSSLISKVGYRVVKDKAKVLNNGYLAQFEPPNNTKYRDSIESMFASSIGPKDRFVGSWFSMPSFSAGYQSPNENVRFYNPNNDNFEQRYTFFKELKIKSSLNSSTLRYDSDPVKGSFDASDGRHMYVFKQNRYMPFMLQNIRSSYTLFNGAYPQQLNFVLEEEGNHNNYYFRLRSYSEIPLVGLTGYNKFYSRTGNYINETQDNQGNYFTQSAGLLKGLSDFSDAQTNETKYQNLEQFIKIDATYKQQSSNDIASYGMGIMLINLPVYYSKPENESEEGTWYLITDNFILRDKLNNNEFSLTSSPEINDKKSKHFPSEYLYGLNNGNEYFYDWFNLSFNTDERNYWTTPSDWWEFLPRYTLTADDFKGELKVQIDIPTFGSKKYEYPNMENLSGSSDNPQWDKDWVNHGGRKIYALDETRDSRIEFSIGGWRTAVTEFKDINYFEFTEQFKTLASNIEIFDPSRIREMVKQKFLSSSTSVPGSNYLENVDLLDLTPNDINIELVSTNLRTGQAIYNIRLKKWIDANYKLHINEPNGPSKDYWINDFYRINGRTQLQKGALKVPNKWKNSLPSSIEQLKDEVKNHIIEAQHEGVVKTIESNYQDFSNEVFTNLGDYLKYRSEDLSISDVFADDDNGILYVNYRLAKTYDTEVDNSNITNTPYEGVIALHGFKTNNKNKVAYNTNTTSLYADQYGLVSGDINNGTYLTPNDGVWQEQNSSVNDGTIILSQQYVQSKKARAALVYDPSRPFDLIIRMYQRSNMIDEYVYKNLFSEKVLYLKKGDKLPTNDKQTLIDSFSGNDEASWTICNSQGNIISKYDLLNGEQYLNRVSNLNIGKNETYEVKQDLYKLVPKSRNLFFNRMIPILNDQGLNTDKMIIFNQEPYLYKNETMSTNKLFVLDFSSLVDNKPKVLQVQLGPEFEQKWITTVGVTARIENSQLQYLFSFITIDRTMNVYTWQTYVLNERFEKVEEQDVHIFGDDKYNLLVDSDDAWKQLIYQIPQFSISYNQNEQIYYFAFILIGDRRHLEINSKSDLRYNMFVCDDFSFEKLDIIDPISGNIITDNQIMPWNTNGTPFMNITFSTDMSEMYFLYKHNNDVLAINYNIAEIAQNYSIDKAKHVNIMYNKNLSEDDVIYPQKDNPNIVNIAFSNKKTNFTNVKTTSELIEIQVNSNFAAMDLSSITSDIIKRDFFTLNDLRDIITNIDYALDNNAYSFNNIVPDYYNGFIYANLVLNNNFNFGFDKLSTVSYPIVFKGFNRQSKATTITINETGKNYFKQLKITEIEAKIKELASNNQLNKYFQILNEPNNKSIDEALVGYEPSASNPTQSIASIKINSKKQKVTIGFNVKEVFGNWNNQIVKLFNHIIYVDVEITNINTSDVLLDAIDIYGNQWKSVTAYEMREDYIKNMNGPNVEKLKDAIIKKLELTGIVTRQDISISNQIEFNNGEGKLFLSFSIDKLVIYDDSFANINLTIKGFKKIAGTSIVKRADHFTNINPSKLQSYLNQNIQEKSLEFVTITNPLSNTEIVSANVLEFDDELGTARVQFSAINFNNSGLNQLPSASSNNSTLNAIITFENLRGSSNASLTSIDSKMDVSNQYSSTVAQDFANNVNVNNSIAINLLTQTNAIKNQAPNTNIEVSSIAFDNKQGLVNIKYTLDKYIGTDNNVVNKPIGFMTSIRGFKKVTGHTSYSLKTILPNWTYEQALEILRNNPNEIKRLIDIQNLPDNANFTIAKVVNMSDSYIVYAQLDKYYINDDFYTIGTNQEVNITIKRTQTYMYYVDSVSYSINNVCTSMVTDSFNDNGSHQENNIASIIIFSAISVNILLLIVFLIIRNKKRCFDK